MGLPGSGKTHLAERLSKYLECAWFNADEVRRMTNDWDFTTEGRIRQANRMKTYANFELSNNRSVICDFVCPTEETRNQFGADIKIWMDTIQEGRFEDTNKMFENPKNADYHFEHRLSDSDIEALANGLKKEINI
jgi:adenylylsulfate kinase